MYQTIFIILSGSLRSVCNVKTTLTLRDWWNIREKGELGGIHDYSKRNNCLATIENYVFLERRKSVLSENV